MNDVNQQFIVAVIIILIGYVLKRSGLVTVKEGQTLNKIILNITLPALIMKVFVEVNLKLELLLLSIICVLFSVMMIFISRSFFRKESGGNKGILITATLGFNAGLFAFPFVESIWGTKGLQYMAMFDMGNAFIIFGLAYIAAIIYSPTNQNVNVKQIVKKLGTFIPFLSYLFALAISLMDVTIPQLGLDILDRASAANSLLVLLVLGIYLDFYMDRSQLKSILKVVTIRYAFGLAIGILLFVFLPFDTFFKATLLLGLVLPAGMAIIPYSVQFQLNEKIAGGVVNLTNVISFGIMWMIFLLVD